MLQNQKPDSYYKEILSMVKAGILVPQEKMAEEASSIAQEIGLETVCCKVIETADSVNEARAAAENGAQIIVARGYQARIIRQYTDFPLVEIRFTAQEIGLLLKRAKEITGKEHPYVYILAFENMLPDLSHMGELMGVRLGISTLDHAEDAALILSQMWEDRPDLVIGGQICCHAAQDMGYLTLHYTSTRESITVALQTALSIGRAMEKEKLNTAQFETMLDTSFSGIIRLNQHGKILVVNRFAEELLGIKGEEVVGQSIFNVFPQFDKTSIDQVLDGTTDSVSTSLNIKDNVWMLLIAPIEYDGNITGAILSFRKASAYLRRSAQQQEQELVRSGYRTNVTFSSFKTDNKDMQAILARAETFALSNSPVLIYEHVGTEANLLARAIHNNSLRKAGPFVSIDVRDLDPDWQTDAFFRRGKEDGSANTSRGAMLKADHGTLFINRIEKLSLQLQHQILRSMMPWTYMHTDARPVDSLDVRIIACAGDDLTAAVHDGRFSEELFYRISSLSLEILPLSRRPEDLRRIFVEDIDHYCKLYNRYLKVTENGLKILSNLKWPGNRAQLDAFCERLVLSATRRQIDERIIQNEYQELYPDILRRGGEDRLVVYKSPKGEEIRALLEKHHGSRTEVAREMGISTTTLWRYMKKYGVETNSH